jgi:hypothetical protein
MTERTVAHKTPLLVLPSSGSTGEIITPAGGSFSTSSSSSVAPASEPQTRRHALMPRAWGTAIKAFAIATLPLADVYDRPRRSLFRRGDYVIVIGEHLPSDLYEEPDSIFAMRPNRPTLWLPDVPIFQPRRPYISAWTLTDDV